VSINEGMKKEYPSINNKDDSQINVSRYEKNSNLELNVSKRSRKFDIINNNEMDYSKKSKTEENVASHDINEKENMKNDIIENDLKDESKVSEEDKELDLNVAVSVANQID